MNISQQYDRCIQSLNLLQTAIGTRAPKTAVKEALAQVTLDFQNIQSGPLTGDALYTLSSRCSEINAILPPPETAKTTSVASHIFSFLAPKNTLSDTLLKRIKSVGEDLFSHSDTVKTLRAEDKTNLKAAYGDHLYPSLFFLSKEFPHVNPAQILHLALEDLSVITSELSQNELEAILRQKAAAVSIPKAGQLRGAEIGAAAKPPRPTEPQLKSLYGKNLNAISDYTSKTFPFADTNELLLSAPRFFEEIGPNTSLNDLKKYLSKTYTQLQPAESFASASSVTLGPKTASIEPSIIKIKGDGSCLFRAFSVGQYLNNLGGSKPATHRMEGNDHQTFRNAVHGYITEQLNPNNPNTPADKRAEMQRAVFDDIHSFLVAAIDSKTEDKIGRELMLSDKELSSFLSPEEKKETKDQINRLQNEISALEAQRKQETSADRIEGTHPYLANLRNDSFYAGNASILALSNIYNMPITVHYVGNLENRVPDQIYNNQGPNKGITVAYDGIHFDLINTRRL